MSQAKAAKREKPPRSKEAIQAEILNEQKLIACVKRYPLLYDPAHPEYITQPKKQDVWNEIANVMGVHANKCKARWNSMRDGYRKSLKKNKQRVQRGEPIVFYKHAKKLEFVRQYLRAADDLDDDDFDVLQPKLEPDDSDSEAESFHETIVAEPQEEGESAAKRWRPEPAEPEHVEYFSEEPPEPRVSLLVPGDAHPVDTFLGCIGAMVKALPPYYQAMAKAEIFQAAHKYELLSIREAGQAGQAEARELVGTSADCEAEPKPQRGQGSGGNGD